MKRNLRVLSVISAAVIFVFAFWGCHKDGDNGYSQLKAEDIKSVSALYYWQDEECAAELDDTARDKLIEFFNGFVYGKTAQEPVEFSGASYPFRIIKTDGTEISIVLAGELTTVDGKKFPLEDSQLESELEKIYAGAKPETVKPFQNITAEDIEKISVYNENGEFIKDLDADGVSSFVKIAAEMEVGFMPSSSKAAERHTMFKIYKTGSITYTLTAQPEFVNINGSCYDCYSESFYESSENFWSQFQS